MSAICPSCGEAMEPKGTYSLGNYECTAYECPKCVLAAVDATRDEIENATLRTGGVAYTLKDAKPSPIPLKP